MFDCNVHPPLCGDKGAHAENGHAQNPGNICAPGIGVEDIVWDDEGGPPDFLYVAFPTAVESDRLPDLKGLLPGNEFIG